MRKTIGILIGGLAPLIAVPALASSNTATIVIEAPAANSTMAQPFTISGFAIDTTGTTGTGVDQVHLWAIPASGPNVFLGIATYGIQRQDVGATYGSRFTNSGYSLVVAGIAPGLYQVVVFAHSTVTDAWDYVVRNVTFTANPVMWVDSPTHNASVAQPFSIVGWAIDLAAASGAGVDQVHVYAFKNPGSGTPAEFWGAATYGLTRDDVGGFYGAQFLHSGFSLSISGKPAAVYYVIVYGHSTVGNTWQAQGFVIYVDMPVVELTIDRQGTGTGGISAAGLTCAGGSTTQAVPCAASYALNTQVQLTAVPDQGNTFGGWQGACTGTSSTCTVMLSSPANVSARFVKNVGTMTATYYHTDAIGSVRAVTNDAGAVVRRHDYGPFGTDNQPMTGDPIRFAGKELDPETGQHYSIARYYRNKWGRFLTVDPLVGNPGDPQTLNPYTYAVNNPLRFVDPSGLQCYALETGQVRCPGQYTGVEARLRELRGARGARGFTGGDGDGNGIGESCSGIDCGDGDEPPGDIDPPSDGGGQDPAQPVQVGVEWLTGLGPRTHTFRDGDRFTEMLRKHPRVQRLFNDVCSGAVDQAGPFRYDLSGWDGPKKYARDYSTVLTLGLTGNLAVTFLGSFRGAYSVSGGVLNVKVFNESTINSATHPPVIGYTPAWDKYIGRPLNSLFSSGPMSRTVQQFDFNQDLRGRGCSGFR